MIGVRHDEYHVAYKVLVSCHNNYLSYLAGVDVRNKNYHFKN